ncbi:HAL/PAL/TAL family ammonia-lyase [Oceanibacterium hippocampi]|uniref:HAL/PAL/TAL family ammonia-lyase n=1 Tax=Oceanibacterium hippocampi TaxID=745714 RepID=UPI000A270317|nr:aromatic amino acid ammonia-lyase [Oceanibacterium hippocampi]
MSAPVREQGLALDGPPLTIADVVRAARAPLRLTLSDDIRARMAATRAVVDAHAAGETPVYGLNTGLGGNLGHRITPGEMAAFQEQMIRGRVVGIGEPLPVETARAALFCRTVALARGGAGISPHVHDLMIEMLARDVTPVVPGRGSIGAGDLALLMAIADVMIGRGLAVHGGRAMPGAEALAAAGLEPARLGPKDGLAIGNGSAVTVAMAALALDRLRDTLALHVSTAAFACAGYGANPRIFDERFADARPAAGQREAAALFRRALKGGTRESATARVQDALSFRTLAPVTGTMLAAFDAARAAVEVELNATADNPLVLPDDSGGAGAGEIHSTANFHTPAIALAFDTLAIAMTHLATASAQRTIKLMTGRLTGLPNYLSPVGGASAGLVPMQKTVAALHAEIRLKAEPASLDALAVSDTVEDVAPQSPLTIRKLDEQTALARWLIAIEALVAAQAADLRFGAEDAAARAGAAGGMLHRIVRAACPTLTGDRETGPDADAVHAALWRADTVAAIHDLFADTPSPISGRGWEET